jgi:uncharacterized protein YbjT (DUF2867 family)
VKVLITGATGTAGSEVVNQSIHDPDVETVTAISRKPLTVDHPKLKTILHKNFLDDSGLVDVFREQDACLWCLGVSQTQVTEEEYKVITLDYTIEAAKTLWKANPLVAFVFLSGRGADSTEQSRTTFARIKGKTENALKQLGMQRLFIVRPGGIKPVRLNPNTSWINKIAVPLLPVLELIAPHLVISATDLAKAMLHIAKHGAARQILENKDLKQIAKEIL